MPAQLDSVLGEEHAQQATPCTPKTDKVSLLSLPFVSTQERLRAAVCIAAPIRGGRACTQNSHHAQHNAWQPDTLMQLSRAARPCFHAMHRVAVCVPPWPLHGICGVPACTQVHADHRQSPPVPALCRRLKLQPTIGPLHMGPEPRCKTRPTLHQPHTIWGCSPPSASPHSRGFPCAALPAHLHQPHAAWSCPAGCRPSAAHPPPEQAPATLAAGQASWPAQPLPTAAAGPSCPAQPLQHQQHLLNAHAVQMCRASMSSKLFARYAQLWAGAAADPACPAQFLQYPHHAIDYRTWPPGRGVAPTFSCPVKSLLTASTGLPEMQRDRVMGQARSCLMQMPPGHNDSCWLSTTYAT